MTETCICRACKKKRAISNFRMKSRFKKREQIDVLFRLTICMFCEADTERERNNKRRGVIPCPHCGQMHKPKEAA